MSKRTEFIERENRQVRACLQKVVARCSNPEEDWELLVTIDVDEVAAHIKRDILALAQGKEGGA